MAIPSIFSGGIKVDKVNCLLVTDHPSKRG